MIHDEVALKKLRTVLDRDGQLASAVKHLDVSNSSCSWTYAKVSHSAPSFRPSQVALTPNAGICEQIHEVFRRTAGLLRTTTKLQSISLLHVNLPDNVRLSLIPLP